MEEQKDEVESQLQQTQQALRQAEQQAQEEQQSTLDSAAAAVAADQLADMEAKAQALEHELADTRCMYEDSVQQVQELRYESWNSCVRDVMVGHLCVQRDVMVNT